MNLGLRHVLLMVGMVVSLPSLSQRTYKVSGEYVYNVPSTQSQEEAKIIAEERAIQQALADEFGTDVSVTNLTDIKAVNEHNEVHFQSYGMSSVKGVWLGSLKATEFIYDYDSKGNLSITAKVYGRARERKGSDYQLEILTLRNGLDEKTNASTTFHSGDDFYVSLLTPIDGFVAIYLVTDDEAFCIYPYAAEGKGSAWVKHGSRHVFFSTDVAEDKSIVDEYTLTTDKSIEYNRVFVVFSPNKFTKVNGINVNGLNMVSSQSFQKWLNDIERADEDMKVERAVLKIVK